MPEIVGKVETNIKDRVNAFGLIADAAATTARDSVNHLLRLEPVQAAAVALEGIGDGVFRFFKKQAEITRRWGK